MSLLLGEFQTIDQAWAASLSSVNEAPGGRVVNLAVVVKEPGAGNSAAVARALDKILLAKRKHSVRTVANTLFPQSLYLPPEFDWETDIPAEMVKQLDDAAGRLYDRYLEMLPTLMTLPANNRGTYFSRMISWPGKVGGLNQLDRRIHHLRVARRNGQLAHSASDIAVESPDGEFAPVEGVGIYAATDERQEGFPCLSHISLTALDGALSMNAVYRHWHLVTRGYGNLVGLSRLLVFLAQQSGFAVGELMVTATKANSERDPYTKTGVTSLFQSVVPELGVEMAP